MYFNSLRIFMSWRYLARLIILICGLFLAATGIVCTYRSDLGLGPWDVLHQGISYHTPLSFGTANIVVGVIIVLLSLLLKVYPGVGTLLNMVLIGMFVDWQLRLNWLSDLSGLPLLLRLLVDVIGVLLMGLPTFRSLKSGFLDMNYCSSCLFCLTVAKPKSTRKEHVIYFWH